MVENKWQIILNLIGVARVFDWGERQTENHWR